jgi:hypothetical protein
VAHGWLRGVRCPHGVRAVEHIRFGV